MRVRSLAAAVASVALVLSAAAACGSSSSSSATTVASSAVSAATTAQPKATGTVNVLAAASLTESFTEIGKAFEADNPGVTVTLNFGASSALVTQITQGAPADVFAAADEANMKKLTDVGATAAAPVIFAKNKLAVIVAKGNPKKVRSVSDLADPKLLVVIAAPEVPIGAYAAQVFHKAGITVTPASLEQNVKAVVSKVTSGEADAGIVYSTDLEAAGDAAEGIAIPDDLNVIANYPIATLKTSTTAKPAAAAFVSYVTGDKGQTTLAEYGFAKP